MRGQVLSSRRLVLVGIKAKGRREGRNARWVVEGCWAGAGAGFAGQSVEGESACRARVERSGIVVGLKIFAFL